MSTAGRSWTAGPDQWTRGRARAVFDVHVRAEGNVDGVRKIVVDWRWRGDLERDGL